ncbi:hypothetical protein NE599_20505, partial [[Clostridium] symbiosum]|uniref:hypothetical protein n=1 Tax=Clostridium symbiosum TaxID=1512 RepID=UPI00210CF93E
YYHYASLSEQAGTADDVFFLHGPADDDNNPSGRILTFCFVYRSALVTVPVADTVSLAGTVRV